MALVESLPQVTVALLIFTAVISLPQAIYLPTNLRLIDTLAYKHIARKSGTEAAKRNLYHPLYRFDLAVANSDATLLTPHGARISQIGTPTVEGASVTAKVLSQYRGPKGVAFKFKRRKGFHKTKGFRRSLTTLEITSIAG